MRPGDRDTDPAGSSRFARAEPGGAALRPRRDRAAAGQGRARLRQLIVKLRVDVFACNQRSGSYARLGIEPGPLAAMKPDLIWLGITGFGPEHDEAAYDPVLQARSGFMELTGETNGSPLV